MATLSTNEITPDGTAPTFVAADAGGDSAVTGRDRFLVVRSTDAGTVDVTIAAAGTLETGADYPDRVYTVPIGGEIWVPLFNVYRDETTDLAEITYETATNLTVAVVSF